MNWTDYELPNGLQWHMQRLIKTIEEDGKVFGCFENDVLAGYVTINSNIFGLYSKQKVGGLNKRWNYGMHINLMERLREAH